MTPARGELTGSRSAPNRLVDDPGSQLHGLPAALVDGL